MLAISLLAACDDDEIENVATARLDALGKSAAAPLRAPATSATTGRPSPPLSVIGLSQQQVETLLGPPMERTDLAPAQAWRYRDERCTLELVFYIDVKSRIFRTLSYDAVSSDGAADAGRRCLAELEAQAHRKIIGVKSSAEPQQR